MKSFVWPLKLTVKFGFVIKNGLFGVIFELLVGQQTPGKTKFLKQTDCLSIGRSNNNQMHLLMSPHSPGCPNGVRQ